MTQYAIVRKLINGGKAEVEVLRGTACGHDCGDCEVCQYASKIRVEAENGVGAQEGDRVEIQSRSSQVLGAAVVVYVIPFVLFFIGYAVASALSLGETWAIVMSFAFFAVGFVFTIIYGRIKKNKPISYKITDIIAGGAE